MAKKVVTFDNEKTDAMHIARCVIYVKTYMKILSDVIEPDYEKYKEFTQIKPICLKVCEYLINEISKGHSKKTDNVYIAVQVMDLLIFYEMAKAFIEPTIENEDDQDSIELVMKLGVDYPTLKKDLAHIDKKIDKLKSLIEKLHEKD